MAIPSHEERMDAREIMAQMEDEARKAVLAEMLPIADLANLAGRRIEEMRADLELWKTERRIISVEHEGVEFFPVFAFNPNSQYLPYPAVKQVMEILSERRGSGWGLASWFVGLNSYLGGRRPLDLLDSNPQCVIDAARDEAEDFPNG